MNALNHIAFKEWAAVCLALAEGRQSIILRKGGIHEGTNGFRVAHREFWLFPTYVHETATGLADAARPLLETAQSRRPPTGSLRFAQYAVVSDVFEVPDERALAGLAGLHVWSTETIWARWRYRQPGLFVLMTRVYNRAIAHEVPDSAHFGGCRSWVELPVKLPADGLQPALEDEAYVACREQIARTLVRATT